MVTDPRRTPRHRLPATAFTALLIAPAAAQSPSERTVQLVEASIRDLHGAMQSGVLTAEGLVERYLARVAAYDQSGPAVNSLIATNPSLIADARRLDTAAALGGPRGALFGIPVLLKDNVDALPMPTTAGSLALAASTPPDDSFLAARLRAAGAIVFGKATMTEFANFMTSGMPNGYSSLGGQAINPYDPAAKADPGGSSSGSGVATAANLVAVAIGTETSGSILSPGSNNGVVGLKPTLGLVSRDGILPITADQDTAGPMGRSVEDVARVLGVIAGHDPNDPATAACLTPGNCFADYVRFLDRGALRGARIALPRSPYWSWLGSTPRTVLEAAVGSLRAAGAYVADPYPILNLNLGGICVSYPPPSGCSTVLIYGMKRDLHTYLASLGPTAPMQSLAQIIAFNNANAAAALRYGQTILVACDQYDTTPNGPDEQRYLADRQRDLTVARGALDAVYAGPDGKPGTADDFDAIVFPANFGADAPARAGYPSITVPAGLYARGTRPPLPIGLTFSGPAFSEPRLLALAYAFEQATSHRTPPASTPALPTDTIPLSIAQVKKLGDGCLGTNGIPSIATDGPPILGNSAFRIALASLRPNAPAFLGVSASGQTSFFGTCRTYPIFPFHGVITGVSNANGEVAFDLAIPWQPALGGTSLFVQGGAVDAAGAALGIVSLTAGLEIVVGG